MINVRVPAKFKQQITLRQYAQGNYIDGIWTDGAMTDVTISASVQPLTSNDLRLLPEGDRAKLGWKVFYNGTFQMGNDAGVKPDEIIVDSILFRVSSLENFNQFGHSEAIFTEAT